MSAKIEAYDPPPRCRGFALRADEPWLDFVEGISAIKNFAMPKSMLTGTAFAGLVTLLAAPAFADTVQRTMTVSGHGEVSGVPDTAHVQAGVTTQAPSAAEALSENSSKMSAVFDALKRAGVAEKDCQTSNFSVAPQYAPYNANATEPAKIVGYQVSDEVDVTLKDVGRTGPVIDALVAAGANQMNSVSFSIRDPKPLLAQARTAAVEDAVARAETLAAAAHVRLGPITSINEGSNEVSRPLPMMRMAVAGAPEQTPVATGEQTIAAEVSITWLIE